MSKDKKIEYGKKENKLADFANAISHPARVAILNEIAKKETCTCGQIVEVIPLSQATVSQHLKELTKTGLIEMVSHGTKSIYSINGKAFKKFHKSFNSFYEDKRGKGN
jgi:ArsR family transcriptional regulator, arsenate/arsenite/antimonite-responsive transcriptional repressor